MPAQNAMSSYGALCADELWNVARLKAYIDNGIAPPLFSINCTGCAGLDQILPCVDSEPPTDGYQLPELDPAPWYDTNVPESKNFAGLLVTDVTMSAPYTRSVTDNIVSGSVLSRLRTKGRTLVITGWLIGKTCCATTYGLRWLTSALGEPPCSGLDCGGCDFDFLDCCPSIGDGENDCIRADGEVYVRADSNSEYENADQYWRRLHGVGVVDGPNVLDCKGRSCGCGCGAILQVEFTLQSSSPYLFSLAQSVVSDLAGPACATPAIDCADADPFATMAPTDQQGFAPPGGPIQQLYTWEPAAGRSICRARFNFLDLNLTDTDNTRVGWIIENESGVLGQLDYHQISTALGIAAGSDIPNGTSGTWVDPATGVAVTLTVSGTTWKMNGNVQYPLRFTSLVGAGTLTFVFNGPLKSIRMETLAPGVDPGHDSFVDADLRLVDDVPASLCNINWVFCKDDQTAENCPAPKPCADDPYCQLPELPPTSSAFITLGCACLPWLSDRLCVSAPSQRDWLSSTFNIEIFGGAKGLRNVLVQFFDNPSGQDCSLYGDCDACGSLFVSYVPPRGTLRVSGEDRTVTVECNNTVTDAFRYVTDREGQAFAWPDISCSDVCLCFEFDCDHYSPDATISIERVDRQL